MKSISGKVVSSKPISLFKASKILSNFAAVENGASQSVQVYLRRSAAAFEELIQVHKDVKTPQKREKHHNRRIDIDKRDEDLEKAETSQQLECDLEIGKHKKKHVAETIVNEEKLEESNEQTDVELDENADIERDDVIFGKEKKKKKRKTDVKLDEREDIERDDVNVGKEKKKKRKNRVVDDEELVDHDSVKQSGRKKRKKKKRKTDGE